MFKNIYKNKTILITGHTGFKGSWLTIWLRKLGANIHGLSLGEVSELSNYSLCNLGNQINEKFFDIRDYKRLEKYIGEVNPDFIFHLAAQALVRKSYNFSLDTITTNAIGSANILESVKNLKIKPTIVMITSDKVYENLEWEKGYLETDLLGGIDPYSASKSMAELAIRSYVKSFYNNLNENSIVGICRAGNVIGGGDWAQDRIVPDSIKSWSSGKVVNIRNPNSTRPWQHVLEPLGGYLLLGSKLFLEKKFHGEAFNFGPNESIDYSVRDLIELMTKEWDKAKWSDCSYKKEALHESALLKLNIKKSETLLNWLSVLDFEETVKMTIDWYIYFYDNNPIDMIDFTEDQINKYEKIAKRKNIDWIQE